MSEKEVEYVSVMEYNENADKQGLEPGERVIVGGHRRNTHVRDDETEGFVEVAEAVAIIELYQPIPEDEVTDWCNSQAGKLALSSFVGNYESEEVIDTGTAAKKRAMTDGGQSKREDPQFQVESRDDLAELLDRAGNWAERDVGADVIAAEFRQARDFVEDELAEEPELVTDGGQSESGLAHLKELEQPWRDEQLLRYLYHEKKLSGMKMAPYLGCSPATVNRWIKRYGITRRENVRVPFYTHSDKGTECWAHGYKQDTDFVYVHRLVAIAEYGLDPVVENDVHHINEIRWDNRPENLTLMSRGEHSSHHNRAVTWVDELAMVEMYREGASSYDIAPRYDVAPGTVINRIRDFDESLIRGHSRGAS